MRYRHIIDLQDALIAKDYNKLYDTVAETDFDINQVGRCNWTPLFVAANLGDVKMVEVFLKMGANPNCHLSANENPSVLAWTIEKASNKENQSRKTEYTQIVMLLLKYGAREVPDNRGQTGLHVAARLGNNFIADTLIKYGFNYAERSRPAICYRLCQEKRSH